MKEPYVEGVATHDDRKPCVGARKGAGEASVAARMGRAIEPRNHSLRGADAVVGAEGHTVDSAIRELPAGRAVGEPVHVRNLNAREPGDPLLARPADHRSGRSGKAMATRLRCTGRGSRMGA